MANHVGNEGTVKIGANTLAEIRKWEFTENAKTVDDGSMGDEWDTHKVTTKDWDGSVDCWWDETDTNGQNVLTVGASVTLHMLPEGATTGDVDYSGTATVTTITRTGSRDGMVEASFKFKGNGALTAGTVA